MLSVTTEGSIFYFRYIFFSLGVWHIYKNYSNLAKHLSYSIILFVFLATLDGYLQFFIGKNIFGWESAWRGMRLAGFFKDELILGSYVTKYAPIGVALFLMSHEISKKNFLFLILFLMAVEILSFISGERAAFFHITLFSILVVILSNRFRLFRLISFILSCIIIFFLLSNSKALQERSYTTLDQVSAVKLKYMPYSPGHEKIYITALKMFKNNPIFGQGTNLFRHLCSKEDYFLDGEPECHSQPHNMYIQLLAENGLIGFLFLIIWFLFFFNISLKPFLVNVF